MSAPYSCASDLHAHRPEAGIVPNYLQPEWCRDFLRVYPNRDQGCAHDHASPSERLSCEEALKDHVVRSHIAASKSAGGVVVLLALEVVPETSAAQSLAEDLDARCTRTTVTVESFLSSPGGACWLADALALADPRRRVEVIDRARSTHDGP
jgi:hypothetical protein